MKTKLGEIEAKMKALNLTMRKSEEAILANNKEGFSRHVGSLAKKVEVLYTFKEEIVELKFVGGEKDEDVQQWSESIDRNLNEADRKIMVIKELLSKLDEEKKELQKAETEEAQQAADRKELEKQLAIEQAKNKLQQEHKEEERRRELKHQEEILNQKLKHQKTFEAEMETKSSKVTGTKLPKRPITKFTRKFTDRLPFWNAFKAEIDFSDLTPVAKFGYLKEWLEPSVRADAEGLPFNTKGYQRAKNILQSEYGKTSEIINAHVQNIMGPPVVSDPQPVKVHEF